MLRTLLQKNAILLFILGSFLIPAFALAAPANGSVANGGSCAGNENACLNGSICNTQNNQCQAVAGNGTVGLNGSCLGNENACVNGLTCDSDNTDTCISESAAASSNSTSNTNGASPNDTPALTNPLQATSLTALLQEVLGYVVEIGSIFLVLMLIWVGFLFVRAQGSDEALKGARSALLWTVIGGLLLLGAQAIAVAIAATASAL